MVYRKIRINVLALITPMEMSIGLNKEITMLKVTPVTSLKDLSKDDLLLIKHSQGAILGRVDCIDGEDLFITAPSKELLVKFPNGKDHFKTTLTNLLRFNKVFRISDEETNS